MTTAPRYVFDVTTLWRSRGDSPVGLTRTESAVAAAALRADRPNILFCRFDRYTQSMHRVERSELAGWLERYGQGSDAKGVVEPSPTRSRVLARRRPLASTGRTIERSVRKSIRFAVSRMRSFSPAENDVIRWRPGDVLVLSGGAWVWINPDRLDQWVGESKIKLAAMIADMIPVLLPHRFDDPHPVQQFTRYARCVASGPSLALHISDHTKADFEEFARQQGLEPPPGRFVQLGVAPPHHAPKPPPGWPANWQPGQFALCVSTIQINKNHRLLYQLWRRMAEQGRQDQPKLVIAGSPGWMSWDLISEITRDPLLSDRVAVLHDVSDANLAWLYQNCRFTLYPSFYEGWGLPIVESLQHGKPCLASNTSSMPQAGQGLATHLDPLDFAAWYQQILRWSADEGSYQMVQQRIVEGYQHRLWSEFGDDYCNMIFDRVGRSDGHQRRRAA